MPEDSTTSLSLSLNNGGSDYECRDSVAGAVTELQSTRNEPAGIIYGLRSMLLEVERETLLLLVLLLLKMFQERRIPTA